MFSVVRIVFVIGFAAAAAAGFYVWPRSPQPPAPPVAMRSDAPAGPATPKAPSAPGVPAQPGRANEARPSGGASPAGPGAGPAAPAPGPVAALPPTAAARPEVPADKGAFDVVRVEPSGEIVVAGRCPAGCVAELIANGRTKDKVTADASGSFAMVPSRLAPGEHQLGLRVTTPDGRQAISEQSVTVSIPAAPGKDVVVVLNEPGAPSRILQRPGEASAAAATAAPAAGRSVVAARSPAGAAAEASARSPAALSLGAVDAENGRFFIQGTAPTGARLRVYLNNALIAEPVAGADGRWSLRVERGLTPGRYVARVDHLDLKNGKVLKRAEAAFSYEAEVASAPAAAGVASPRVSPRPSGSPVSPAGAGPSPQALAALGERSTEATSGAANAAPAIRSAGEAARALPGRAGTEAGSTRTAAGPTGLNPLVGSKPALSGEPIAADRTESGSSRSAPLERLLASVAPSSSSRPAAADLANPIVASIDTAQVRRGDSLWRISRTTYGSGRRYTVIFTANDAQIRNPNLIYPGQILVLPSDPKGPSAAR